ncbi:MAG: hypothetical protein ACOCUV_03075, partial [bacterium]
GAYKSAGDTRGGTQRFGFNSMEKDDEWTGSTGSHYDFGARIYDSRIARFFKVDDFANKFPYQSSYLFAGNTPIAGVDINGDSLYILTYVEGSSYRGSDMFKAAALTRKVDIESSGYFDPKRDKVVVLKIQDVSTIKTKVEKTVDRYSAKYGNTVEFGVWSHAGMDGPTGSEATTTDALDGKQMTLSGWGKINFNWEQDGNSRAGFYGCKTGVNKKENWFSSEIANSSFSARISSLQNFENVNVYGQQNSSYPSIYTNYRNNLGITEGSFIKSESNGKINFYKTYLVGGIGRSQDWNLNEQNVALPMRVSKNGNQISNDTYQTGRKKED